MNKKLLVFPRCTEIIPNRDIKSEVRTKPSYLCTVTPLIYMCIYTYNCIYLWCVCGELFWYEYFLFYCNIVRYTVTEIYCQGCCLYGKSALDKGVSCMSNSVSSAEGRGGRCCRSDGEAWGSGAAWRGHFSCGGGISRDLRCHGHPAYSKTTTVRTAYCKPRVVLYCDSSP